MKKIIEKTLNQMFGAPLFDVPFPLFLIHLMAITICLVNLSNWFISAKEEKTKNETKPVVEKVEPPLVVPGFEFIKFSGGGNDAVNTLNHWRQTNYDKHIISFCEVHDGFIIRWSSNPGNSRQVFVAQYSSEPCSHLSFMKLIQDEYYNHEIVDISSEIRGYIFLLQEKLEPYEPSKE